MWEIHCTVRLFLSPRSQSETDLSATSSLSPCKSPTPINLQGEEAAERLAEDTRLATEAQQVATLLLLSKIWC